MSLVGRPPRPFARAGQEQVADARRNLVTFQAEVATTLPLAASDHLLLIPEAALDVPLRVGEQQQRFDAHLGRRVADQVRHVGMVQDRVL